MKVLITENKFKDVAKSMLIDTGVQSTIEFLGGFDNFCKVFNIEGPMDFLHLFDDLEQVQSEEYVDLILFRYKPNHNFMVYDTKNEIVSINYDEIWSFLRSNFGLNYQETQGLTKEWLGEVYNLRGVTTFSGNKKFDLLLGEVYNLKTTKSI
jgi:hypothetical protein